MHKGADKLKKHLKPNETPVNVKEETQQNIRQVKTVAGMACQVSGAVVSAVSAMTVQLGRKIAPVIVEKGGKVLPESVKRRDDVDGRSTMDEIVQVAVSGARGGDREPGVWELKLSQRRQQRRKFHFKLRI